METIREIVLRDIETAKENDYTSYLKDVIQNGCVSGIVSGLINYSDTCDFFMCHKEEINSLLAQSMQDVGETVENLFGEKWDIEDPLCLETNNQNLLAWFGYEETARIIFDELESNI